MDCFFVSDLHGKLNRYYALQKHILLHKPKIVFIGGDILPHAFLTLKDEKYGEINDFINDFLIPLFQDIRSELKENYPDIFIIMGNDDPRIEEQKLIEGQKLDLWNYIHNQKFILENIEIYGYAMVPPTPFQLKDWELYDVSRFVDPDCVPPTAGIRTVNPGRDIEYATIANDLMDLAGSNSLENAIFLFHSPPYQTNLDRANLDGQTFDHVPLDVHVGSIAIQRFIEDKQPLLTLHGHVHESSSITGAWKDKIGKTYMFSAAYEKENLAIIKFNLSKLEAANRVIV